MPVVFDLHCDTPRFLGKKRFNHVTPARLRSAQYTGAIFAHFVPPRSKEPFVDAVKLITTTLNYLEDLDDIILFKEFTDYSRSKVNIILGVEGGHIFDYDPKQIEVLYNLGVRVFTLTWNNSNRLAHSALEHDRKGLTAKGKKYLKYFKDYNVILDMSHASTRTVLDVCSLYGGRVMASHSCVRALNPFLRNIDDAAIKAIAGRKGVVGVNFSRYHLGKYTPFDHIDYMKTNFGPTLPAIGSDFDGIDDAVITDPAAVQDIAGNAQQKGYEKTDIDGFFYKNFLSFLH